MARRHHKKTKTDKNPRLNIGFSDEVIKIMDKRYERFGYKHTFPNRDFNNLICTELKRRKIDALFCYICGEIKLSSEFYAPSHSLCKSCADKHRSSKYKGNWLKAIEKTGGKCALCGDNFTDIHHINPISSGGNDDIENLIPLCKGCHLKAHNNTYTKIYGINEELAEYFKSLQGAVN